MRPRREQVDRAAESTYHCTSRVVRRAFLLSASETGDSGDSRKLARKPWLEDRLRELARIFAIDLDGFAIMDSHVHLVLTLRPELVKRWSREEIARRWLCLFPPVDVSGKRREATVDEIEVLAADEGRIARLRDRLCDLGEYHKALKEPLARRVNREEGVTGHFWEGRFKSKRVLDVAALFATMAYVDLNVIRAEMAQTPESSEFTGAWHRAKAVRQGLKRRSRRTGGRRSCREGTGRGAGTLGAEATPSFLTPIRSTAGRRGVLGGMTVEQYLAFVDRMGRLVRSEKRGRIPSDLAPILERLELDVLGVLEQLASAAEWFGSVVGKPRSCAAEAVRCDRRRVVSALRLGGG